MPIVTPKGGFSVAASPFNSVKFELGLLLLCGVILLSTTSLLGIEQNTQFILHLVYGVAAAIWVAVRVRRIAKFSEHTGPVDDGKE